MFIFSKENFPRISNPQSTNQSGIIYYQCRKCTINLEKSHNFVNYKFCFFMYAQVTGNFLAFTKVGLGKIPGPATVISSNKTSRTS